MLIFKLKYAARALVRSVQGALVGYIYKKFLSRIVKITFSNKKRPTYIVKSNQLTLNS